MRTVGRRDMTKIMAAFRNFAKARKAAKQRGFEKTKYCECRKHKWITGITVYVVTSCGISGLKLLSIIMSNM